MKSGFWLTLIGLPLVVVVLWFSFSRFEGHAPRIIAPEQIVLGQNPQEIEIQISDEDSGIRSVSARLLHEAGSKSLLQEAYPGDLMMGGGPKGGKAGHRWPTCEPALTRERVPHVNQTYDVPR